MWGSHSDVCTPSSVYASWPLSSPPHDDGHRPLEPPSAYWSRPNSSGPLSTRWASPPHTPTIFRTRVSPRPSSSPGTRSPSCAGARQFSWRATYEAPRPYLNLSSSPRKASHTSAASSTLPALLEALIGRATAEGGSAMDFVEFEARSPGAHGPAADLRGELHARGESPQGCGTRQAASRGRRPPTAGASEATAPAPRVTHSSACDGHTAPEAPTSPRPRAHAPVVITTLEGLWDSPPPDPEHANLIIVPPQPRTEAPRATGAHVPSSRLALASLSSAAAVCQGGAGEHAVWTRAADRVPRPKLYSPCDELGAPVEEQGGEKQRRPHARSPGGGAGPMVRKIVWDETLALGPGWSRPRIDSDPLVHPWLCYVT